MSKTSTIEIPIALVKKMDKAVKTIENFTDEFEDFILAKDKKFIDKMHKARKEHISGHIKSFDDLKKKYV
ncbi:MAG: hypothetical protein A2231_04145 [Candidatus Firestonebacteria bacterium RIFOXYA2_FULL_40_8]|nr:MAG: hypothetical protein A2231_04145 [Candidatus Firestonebacteria bacterium RIFOXYA2_FULL_40_8]